jgi:hypothetical protein
VFGTELNYRLNWLYKISGTAAVIAGALLLIAALNLIVVGFHPGTINGRPLPFQDNWLVVIFKLLAGFTEVRMSLLHVLNFLDIAILALAGLTVLGLYIALRSTSKIWAMIALAQPFLGILLFIATQNAGRSSVMGAVLVISFILLRNKFFNRSTAYLGILASVLLLAGDFTAGLIPPTYLMAALFGLGYVLLILWFFLIGRNLFQLGKAA